MKNYDQAAIASVFQNNCSLRHLIRDALAKFEEDLDEEMTFADAMELFHETFETIASEHAATKALGVDIAHYYVRENSQMTASDVQHQIDHVQFKDLDKCVNDLLVKIGEGDYATALEQYQQVFNNCLLDQPKLSRKDLNQYLVNVNREVGTVDASVNLKALLGKLGQESGI